MKLKCAIVDDEPLAVSLIRSYVQQVPKLEIAAICNSASEAFSVLKNQKIDLLFLDIQMPKMLGTDFLRNLSDPPKVIFITAHRDYAIEGFDLDVVDFLLKPVSFNRFIKAVNKATKLLSVENNLEVSSPNNIKEKPKGFLYFKAGREMIKIMVHEILLIESRKEYVMLFFDDGSSVMIKQSISSMEKILSPHEFVRVHRSFIVTIAKIKSFTTAHVILINKKIPIGRLYKNGLNKILPH